MYLRFSKKGVPSASYTEVPNTPVTPPAPVPASFDEGSAYRIKNVNSGLYMQVADAKAENGANVQQWGTDSTAVHDIWKFFSAGDGGTYILDVAGKKSDNGTNIDIYQYNGGTNQQFMLTQNDDGSYKIRTKISGENSLIEVIEASSVSGANIQEWEINGANCQDWILELATDSGCVMDETLMYTFENVNSGMVMDIENGSMTDSTNVRQWDSNGYDCQKWVLKSFGSGNYYWIHSAQDENYVLKANGSTNGSNISISPYSTKDSSQLFRFTKNLDGTYSITTRASKDKCLVETDSASKENGANIQQWKNNGNACQKWNMITEKKPESVKTVKGDVNNDGQYTIADIVLLQKWLLAVPSTTLENWKAADLDENNSLDVFDLCLMRQLLIK